VAAPAGVKYLPAFGAAAERAGADVRRLWGTRPGPGRFVVFVAPDTRSFRSWFSRTPRGEALAGDAVGVTHQQYALASPTQAPRFGGSRIVIDRSRVQDPAQLTIVLRHEFTHAIDLGVRVQAPAASSPGYPVWVEEGFAAWSEEADVPLARSRRLAGLRAHARRGYRPTTLPPDDGPAFYAGSTDMTDTNYESAASVFRYVAERWGRPKAIAMYTHLASGTGDAAAAVLGQSWDAFVAGWQAWLQPRLT